MNHAWDQSYREITSLDQHSGSHSGVNQSLSSGIDANTQQSLQTVTSEVQSFAKKYGIEESRAMSILGSASAGGKLGIVNIGMDYKGSASKQAMIDEAYNVATSKDFCESMSQLKRFSQNQDWHEGQDVGKRLSENLSSTFDKTDHLSKSMSQNLSASEHYESSRLRMRGIIV